MPDGGVGEGWLETAFKKAERKKQKETNKQTAFHGISQCLCFT